MAQIDEIVGKSNIQGVMDLDKALVALDETFMKVLKSSKETSTILNTQSDSWNKLKIVQEQTAEQTKKLGDAEKQSEKIAKDQAAAVASLEKQRQAAYAQMAKQEQKERELAAAIAMEVKSISDAEKQNKALLEAKKKLNLTTEEGKKKNQEYNNIINKNTEFIRANSDAATKQRMNIGNYGSAIKGVGAQLLSFASGIGVGIGAMSAFKSVMTSTESISDSFARNIEGLKEGFGFLARSVANLNFTNLIQGFRDAFSEGKRYADVLDEIEDRERALGIRQKEIQGQILDQKAILRSSAQTVDAKEAALAEITRLMQQQLDEAKSITQKEIDNQLQSGAAEVFGAKQVTEQRKALILDFISASGTAFDTYQAKLEEAAVLEAKLNSLIKVSVDDRGRMSKDMYAYNAAVEALNPNEKELLDLLQISNLLTGTKRDLIADAAKKDLDAVNAQKEGVVSLARDENRLRNEYIKGENEKISLAEKSATEQDRVADMFQKQQNDNVNELQKLIHELSKADEIIEETFDIPDPKNEIDPWLVALEETQQVARDAFAGTEEAQKEALERQLENLKNYRALGLITEQEYQAAVNDIETVTREERLQKAAQYTDMIAELGNTLLEIQQMQLDNEVAQLQNAKDYELQLAGDNQDKITAINEKYAEKEKALKIKAAKQNKTTAIFNAIIGTAQAVISGLATMPFFPLGIIMGALAGVLGAVQIGLIASQPIPQFFKGTKSAPDGVISVAEKGEELIKTRSGKLLMATRPTLLSGMKGAQIYTNKETEQIMKLKNVGYDSKELQRTLRENNDSLIRTIKNKKEIYITPAKNTRVTEREGAYFKTYFNRKLG